MRSLPLLALPLLGVVLWGASLAFEWARRLRQQPMDPAGFEERVASRPPEVVRALASGEREAPLFEDFLERLSRERKLAIQVQPAPDEESLPRARLRLLVSPDALGAYEREVVEALFAGRTEISTEEVQRRHAGHAFDPDPLLQAALARAVPAEGKRPFRPIADSLALLLLVAGAVFALRDLWRPGGGPYAIVAGLAGGWMLTGIWPVHLLRNRAGSLTLLALAPLLVLALVAAAVHLAPHSRLQPAGAIGLTLLLLGWYQALLNRARPWATGEQRRVVDELLHARRWAACELGRPQPGLRDAWVPHLVALGLGAHLARWRNRFGGVAAPVADLSELPPGTVPVAAPFTGTAPRSEIAEEDWTDGFYVFAEEDDEPSA